MLRGGNKQALRGTTRRPDRPSHALLHHSGAPPARRKTLLFSLHLFSQSGSLERWLISTECSRVCDCSLLTGRRPIICLSCAHTSFLLFFFPFSFLTPPFVLQGSVLCLLKWIDNRGWWQPKNSVFFLHGERCAFVAFGVERKMGKVVPSFVFTHGKNGVYFDELGGNIAVRRY